MPVTAAPEWQEIALYAVIAALFLMLLWRIPYVGRVIRLLFSFGLLALFLYILIQQAPYDPNLSPLTGGLGLDRQEVVGNEVRVRMAADGHFWANATINGLPRRMLIDSGATMTVISDRTAAAAAVDRGTDLAPMVLRTASGFAPAHPATVDELRIGNITATNLKVLTSPALGNMDVLGMNFLSRLASWRVEGRTLVLVPQPSANADPG